MQEQTISSTKTKVNCINDFTQRLNNSYFLEEFNNSKIPQRYKSLGKKVRERRLKKKQYDEIIGKFFDIFYNELYFLNKPSYFFLGGFLEKKRSKPGIRRVGPGDYLERKQIHVEFPITISWTDVFFLNQKQRQVSYIKTKGSTSATAAIEKKWIAKNNFYDLKPI